MELLCERVKSSTEVNETVRSIADDKKVYDKAIADTVEQTLHKQLFQLGNNKKIRLLEKTQLDNVSSIAKAKEEGLEKGIKKGKQEGIKEGLEKWKIESQKQIALNMKEQELEDDFIVKCLNVSINDLKLLLNNK